MGLGRGGVLTAHERRIVGRDGLGGDEGRDRGRGQERGRDGMKTGTGTGGSARFESRARLGRPSTAPVRGGGQRATSRGVIGVETASARIRSVGGEGSRETSGGSDGRGASRPGRGDTRAPVTTAIARRSDARRRDIRRRDTYGDVTPSASDSKSNRAERPARTLRDDDPFASTGPIEAPFEEEEEGEDPWDVRARIARRRTPPTTPRMRRRTAAGTQSPPGSGERAARLRCARLLARREREAFARGETSPSFLSSPRAVAAGRAAATTAEEEREKAANARRRERVMESTRRELRAHRGGGSSAREGGAAKARTTRNAVRRGGRGHSGRIHRGVGSGRTAPAVAFSASAFSASGTPARRDRSEPTWNLWWNISSGS